MSKEQQKLERLRALMAKQHHGMQMKPLPAAIRRLFWNGLPVGWGQ